MNLILQLTAQSAAGDWQAGKAKIGVRPYSFGGKESRLPLISGLIRTYARCQNV